jgi:hypothetical protein
LEDISDGAELDEQELQKIKEILATERVRDMQANLLWQKPIKRAASQDDQSISRPGSMYSYYRNVEDLPEKARGFYEKAGMGISP